MVQECPLVTPMCKAQLVTKHSVVQDISNITNGLLSTRNPQRRRHDPPGCGPYADRLVKPLAILMLMTELLLLP
ncbi:hypothetical protein Pcinc_039147 [Petrolisthes cinctipes]|uniref:Uncharacterized protein n=1 Tax=Petrolisthes cinctipes TaxID=88211 RepID=A0AAE1EJL4_PETCI|nr:hypothetical protein Pcinc_039147 [Petrolisthes cinctipes]